MIKIIEEASQENHQDNKTINLLALSQIIEEEVVYLHQKKKRIHKVHLLIKNPLLPDQSLRKEKSLEVQDQNLKQRSKQPLMLPMGKKKILEQKSSNLLENHLILSQRKVLKKEETKRKELIHWLKDYYLILLKNIRT
jgi:hypothetical protein